MARFRIALAVGLLLMVFAGPANAAAGRRVAFVVGVSAYESVPALPNAVNDANAMADLFRKAGFDVVEARTDVGNLAFRRAMREFEDAVTDADIAVVYYAGHGIEVSNANYLIPADAKLANERDVEDEAIPLDRVISTLESAKRLRLVILDACRDNPFTGKMRKRVATRAVSPGLGRVDPQLGETLIAYAAKEKSVAADGSGAHSPFTTALLNNLTVPGLDVRLAFGRVRDEVWKSTNRQQEPFVYGSLGGGTVALVPAPAVPVAKLSDDASAKSDYELVERVGKREAWIVYLNTHKTGLYADLARVQLAKLDESKQLVRTDTPSSPLDSVTRMAPKAESLPDVSPVPQPTAAEQKAWDKLKTSTDQAAIGKFIEKFPSSPLVKEAEERLATLERLAREREDALRIEREAAKQRDEDERQKKAAEAERVRMEKEAARQRQEEEKAKAAEIARQKAEALAAARQKEAEERARAAEARAKQQEEEERAKAAAIAERKRQAEEQARAAEAERQKDIAEAAERKRLADEAAKQAAAEKAARDAEEKARAAAIAERKRQAEEQARAAEFAARKQAAEEAAQAARTAAEKKKAEDEARAVELAAKKQAEEQAKAAELAAKRLEAEEKARAAAELAAKQKQADEQKSAEARRLAEEKAKAAQVEREKAQAINAKKRDDDELKAAEARREKARAEAEAERRKAAEAAREAVAIQAQRAAAAKQRQAAEAAREAAEEAAASRRKAAAEAANKAAERQAERAAAARAAAQQAAKARAAQPRPVVQAAPRPRAEPRPVAVRAGGGGGGSAPMVGIGF